MWLAKEKLDPSLIECNSKRGVNDQQINKSLQFPPRKK